MQKSCLIGAFTACIKSVQASIKKLSLAVVTIVLISGANSASASLLNFNFNISLPPGSILYDGSPVAAAADLIVTGTTLSDVETDIGFGVLPDDGVAYFPAMATFTLVFPGVGQEVALPTLPLYYFQAGSDDTHIDRIGLCGNFCFDSLAAFLPAPLFVPDADIGQPLIIPNNASVDIFMDNLEISGVVAVGLRLNGGSITGSVSAVPIPPAVWLFGSGILGLIGIARRKKTA